MVYQFVEGVRHSDLAESLIKFLVDEGVLIKTETIVCPPLGLSDNEKVMHVIRPLKISPKDNVPCNPYIGNGKSIESNFESIAKANLGVCDDKKYWGKQLKEAVKEYGHDQLLTSFYEWTEAQAGMYMNRKPIQDFLKNVGQNLASQKPVVSNPLLDKTEKGIALLTNNKVFFTGEYRVRLAMLLKEHGLNPVNQAFAEFWYTVDEKNQPWAARDFLQRATLMINTNKIKHQQALQQAQAVAEALESAKQSVETVEEEEEL